MGVVGGDEGGEVDAKQREGCKVDDDDNDDDDGDRDYDDKKGKWEKENTEERKTVEEE